MILLFLIGLVLTATAVALIARGFIVARLRTTESLGSISQYGFSGHTELLNTEGGLRGFFDDLASSVGNVVLRQLRFGSEDDMRKLLVSAGLYRLTPRMLMGYQVLCTIAFPTLWIWLVIVGHVSTGVALLGVVAALIVGWMAPPFVVRRRAESRLAEIDYDIPELIDLLVVTVEAGLGLGAALQIASERLTGPLGDELRIVIQEQRMGLPSLQALENMLARCPTSAMRSFVRSMIQGERLGVSVGQIMRSLALEMRKRRRAAAEERAHKAPIKIIFPLIFLIFPAMFVVLLGPAVFGIFDALNSR